MAFSYRDYQESDRVKKLAEQLSKLEAAKPGAWTGGQYGQQMQDALKALQNRKKFSYDVNSDALYQQYKDKYVQQGKQAMQDTMGQAAALTDEQAAKAPRLYPTWAAGLTVKAGDRLYYPGTDRLYKVVSDHTTQADWTPDAVPALYTVIDVAHAGTRDDPIPAERGMEYVYGLYYSDSEDGKLYLCQRTGEAAGGTVVLQYLPHELVGHYFVEVT